jgi:DNA-directed RNA polymerase specialized sigma24 family protein
LVLDAQVQEGNAGGGEGAVVGAVRPVLDEAIASLGDEDRNALLLRFFQNESLTSVGAKLGVSEDAAQKRVSRALGKLRELLAGRGINTTAAALSVVLTANGVQAAPAGFAASPPVH